MAALNTILNLVTCGLGAVLGTGTKGCKQFMRKTTTLWFVPDGFEFDGAQTLDDTYAKLLQAQGNLIVLKDAKTFADNSSDDIIETLEDGTKQLATEGLYEFALTFINGLAFHAALTSLNSFGSYNVLFVDRDGNMLGTKADSGNLKGFSVGMLQAMKLSFPTDSVGQKEGLAFQLTRRRELDTDYVYISNDQLNGFKPQNLDGINEVVLSYATTPADGDTDLVIDARLKQNQKPFTGADDLANYLIQVAGSTVTPSGITESAIPTFTGGRYTFTGLTLSTGDAVGAAINDTANNRAVIDLGGDLYKSNTASIDVVA